GLDARLLTCQLATALPRIKLIELAKLHDRLVVQPRRAFFRELPQIAECAALVARGDAVLELFEEAGALEHGQYGSGSARMRLKTSRETASAASSTTRPNGHLSD